MSHDLFTTLISQAENPERVSSDGQALSLMTRLLTDIHRLNAPCLYRLEMVYNEAEKLGLREEDLKGLIVLEDAWRSFVARFLDVRNQKFVKAVEEWLRSLPKIPPRTTNDPQIDSTSVEHPDHVGEPEPRQLSEFHFTDPFTFYAMLSTVTDRRLSERPFEPNLSEKLLEIMQDHARYALAHNALEFSLPPSLTLPAFDPLLGDSRSYKDRCDRLIARYVEEMLELHDAFGAVAFSRRSSEDKHIRALAYRLSHPGVTWNWIAEQEEIMLTVSAVVEGAQEVAKRIGFKLPRNSRR